MFVIRAVPTEALTSLRVETETNSPGVLYCPRYHVNKSLAVKEDNYQHILSEYGYQSLQ